LTPGRRIYWIVRQGNRLACQDWRVSVRPSIRPQPATAPIKGTLEHRFYSHGESGTVRFDWQVRGAQVILSSPRLESTSGSGASIARYPNPPSWRMVHVTKDGRRIVRQGGGLPSYTFKHLKGDVLALDSGAWYLTRRRCEKVLTTTGAKPFDLKGLTLPRPSVPAWIKNPKRDYLRQAMARKGRVYVVVRRSGRKVCQSWRFDPSKDPTEGELVRRVRNRRKRTVTTHAWGYQYQGKVIHLTGPSKEVKGPGFGSGSAAGCLEVLQVDSMTRWRVKVAGESWFLTRAACRRALPRASGDGTLGSCH
jgi:hypothetical protein